MSVHVTARVRDEVIELLDDLSSREPNFTTADGPFDAEHGWKVDDRCQPLPSESPGEPVEDGSFARARRILTGYEMADPAIIRAAFDPEVPLAQRDMALEGRFLFLRFPMGVRITHVVDDTIRVDGHQVRRWGWGYSTLEGHLEQGRMDWEVWKWLDTGQVEFRIHSFSRQGDIRNPVVRLGFALFGSWTQERFYRKVRERMDVLVAAEVGRAPAVETPCVGVSAVASATFGPEGKLPGEVDPQRGGNG
jgi:uncharacterized protein (UPF0548 family)